MGFRIKLFAGIHNLTLEKDENIQNIEIDWPHFSLSNHDELREKLIFTEKFKQLAGTAYIKAIQPGMPYVYSAISFNENVQTGNELYNIALREVNFRMSAFKGLLSFFWFIKDNCINTTQVIADIPEYEDAYITAETHRAYSTSSGSQEETVVFSAEEIAQVKSIVDKYAEIAPLLMVKKETIDQIPNFEDVPKRVTAKGLPTHISYNSYNRIERAIMFLNAARTQSHLPFKISLYIPIYECLFSYESDEVSFKISIRASTYLSERDTSFNRLELFNKIREAYNVRSRFLHGSRLNKNKKKEYTNQEFENISKDIDHITRTILKRIILNDSQQFLQNDEVIKDFFDTLIFPKPNFTDEHSEKE